MLGFCRVLRGLEIVQMSSCVGCGSKMINSLESLNWFVSAYFQYNRDHYQYPTCSHRVLPMLC